MDKANTSSERMQLYATQKSLQHACPTLDDGTTIDAGEVETGTLTDLPGPNAPGLMTGYINSTSQSIVGNI